MRTAPIPNLPTIVRLAAEQSDLCGGRRGRRRAADAEVRYTWDTAVTARTVCTATLDLSPSSFQVADGKVYVSSYTYDGAAGRIASITQTDGSRLDVAYDSWDAF